MVKESAYRAVSGYFALVQSRGYVPYKRVNKVVLLCMLDEFIDRFRFLMSEDDIREIQEILTCLYGSDCLIPYPGRNNLAEYCGMWHRQRKHPEKKRPPKVIDAHQQMLEDVLKPWNKKNEHIQRGHIHGHGSSEADLRRRILQ